MTRRDDKADCLLSQTKRLIEQLSHLEDRLQQLLAAYQFYDQAIRAMVETGQLDDTDDDYLGWFIHQHWLQQQSQLVVEELVDIRESLLS